ncbi:MAG TPA: hypothetical protein PK926_09975 [Spirochaetota bacterium]|nr:hypothetical protein [Spirochaetota bacterium]HPI88854.1 hypothetical protein [Spirochaetota bacterium]HPR47658.1 hypothetical protein [Spirochaetota bacterium]
MPGKNDDFDFGPLMDDDETLKDFTVDDDDLFSFDAPENVDSQVIPDDTLNDYRDDDQPEEKEVLKKRSSEDFSPDMDALLLTAQSPMIVEGMKYLTLKDFSSKRHHIFLEAVKGVDLYLKIIERNPGNYRKLLKTLSSDIDCMEVEKITSNLYKNKYGEPSDSVDKKLRAFEMLREKLKNAYDKTLISSSMVGIKKYFLLSGSLDQEKVSHLVKDNNAEFKSEVAKLDHNIRLAMEILKQTDCEIAKGMKGKDINIFIIKGSQMLYYFYMLTGKKDAAEYFRRINANYKKYFVIRD